MRDFPADWIIHVSPDVGYHVPWCAAARGPRCGTDIIPAARDWITQIRTTRTKKLRRVKANMIVGDSFLAGCFVTQYYPYIQRLQRETVYTENPKMRGAEYILQLDTQSNQAPGRKSTANFGSFCRFFRYRCVGSGPIDMQSLGVDFLICSSYRFVRQAGGDYLEIHGHPQAPLRVRSSSSSLCRFPEG